MGDFLFNFFLFWVLMACWFKWMLATHDKNGVIEGHVKGYAKRGILNLLNRWMK